HACARRFLRTVVEVEPNRRLREVEAERRDRLETDLRRSLLRVDRLERREPANVGEVRGGGLRIALGAEQPREPLLAQRETPLLDLLVRPGDYVGEVAHRDLLLLLVPRDRITLSREIGFELLVRAEQVETLIVERRGRRLVDLAELLAFAVAV